MQRLITLASLLVACGDNLPGERALGMNDVSLLLPLPTEPATPRFLGISEGPLVGEALVASLVFASGIGPKNQKPIAYEDFQVVAIRFELCDRAVAGPCPEDADGRLRLVLQPMFLTADGVSSHDIALHAFYPIPHGELAGVIHELRALGAEQDLPIDAPLQVNPMISEDYVVRLRTLVQTYASQASLIKLTVMGQNAISGGFAWIMGGFDRAADGSFVAFTIPNLGASTRQNLLAAGGGQNYEARPVVDTPPGFTITLGEFTFLQHTHDEQRFALEALAAIQNPMHAEANDLQCVTCHVATIVSLKRAEVAGIALDELENTYRSPYNTTVDSITSYDARSVRAFGWAGAFPGISQRVANDTARVLLEIEERFPAHGSEVPTTTTR